MSWPPPPPPPSADRRSRRRRRRRQDNLRESERLTRKRSVFWDRVKFSVLIIGVWFIVVWYEMSTDPVLSFKDAAKQQLQVGSGAGRWLVILIERRVRGRRQAHPPDERLHPVPAEPRHQVVDLDRDRGDHLRPDLPHDADPGIVPGAGRDLP
jgi:hypothetical protein